jgi:hypothetical protein
LCARAHLGCRGDGLGLCTRVDSFEHASPAASIALCAKSIAATALSSAGSAWRHLGVVLVTALLHSVVELVDLVFADRFGGAPTVW